MGLIHVGEYEFNEKDKIGQGGFGTVFKGRKSNNHSHLVAVKVVKKAGMFSEAKLLEKEIKILHALTNLHHPNLVRMYDCIEKQDYVCIIMEYCNGGDFASYLQANSVLSENTIKLFLRQIAYGMSAIHSKTIVHRDIKPQNFLLTHHVPPPRRPQPSDITIKIADFGISRFLIKGSMAGTVIGTPAYMAPETVIGLKYDFKADLWSLGVTLYQCLTGKFPFKAMAAHELRALFDNNVDQRPSIPSSTSQELRDLLINLLRLNPRDRMTLEDFYRHPFVRSSNNHPKDHGGPAPMDHGVRWVEASGGQVPGGAVIGGQDRHGEIVYVARAVHGRATLPGKLVPAHRCAYVPWGGQEHSKTHYQILVGNFKRWVSTNGANVPSGALVGGETEDGEPLFIGRVHHEGSVYIGKVQKSHRTCYIPIRGKEVGFDNYEILMKC